MSLLRIPIFVYIITHVRWLQAGLLAQQDSFVPFIWVAVQSVLNIVGDLVLIMHFQLGLQGAAWATVLSQLVGTLGLLLMFKSRGQVNPLWCVMHPLRDLQR